MFCDDDCSKLLPEYKRSSIYGVQPGNNLYVVSFANIYVHPKVRNIQTYSSSDNNLVIID